MVERISHTSNIYRVFSVILFLLSLPFYCIGYEQYFEILTTDYFVNTTIISLNEAQFDKHNSTFKCKYLLFDLCLANKYVCAKYKSKKYPIGMNVRMFYHNGYCRTQQYIDDCICIGNLLLGSSFLIYIVSKYMCISNTESYHDYCKKTYYQNKYIKLFGQMQNIDCPICLNNIINNPVTLKCGHIYHEECLIELINKKNKCSVCNKYFMTF